MFGTFWTLEFLSFSNKYITAQAGEMVWLAEMVPRMGPPFPREREGGLNFFEFTSSRCLVTTSNKCHASSNKCLTSSNKKLLELK